MLRYVARVLRVLNEINSDILISIVVRVSCVRNNFRITLNVHVSF